VGSRHLASCALWSVGTIVPKLNRGKFYRHEAMKPPVHALRDLGRAIKKLRLEREMTRNWRMLAGWIFAISAARKRTGKPPTFGVL
jgi:hypothetical protein